MLRNYQKKVEKKREFFFFRLSKESLKVIRIFYKKYISIKLGKIKYKEPKDFPFIFKNTNPKIMIPISSQKLDVSARKMKFLADDKIHWSETYV